MNNHPVRVRGGETIYFDLGRPINADSEEGLLLTLLGERQLFGQIYSRLQPDYFWNMPPESGVLCCPFARTAKVIPGAVRPGDIDLLLLPYENDQLVLSRAMAIEVKVVRASFARPGKSPNDFGYSQASSLLDLGFPYAALMHLIISDSSPEEAWREVLVAQVEDEDRVKILEPQLADMLPTDLVDRSFGRLEANSVRDELGLAAVYVKMLPVHEGHTARKVGGIRMPLVRRAEFNPSVSPTVYGAMAQYYEAHSRHFLQTPRFDPV